jgi:hypothetical protein
LGFFGFSFLDYLFYNKSMARRALPTQSFDHTEALIYQLQMAGLPQPQREYLFHSKRKWRFDFAWPDLLIAVEVEGGVWVGGRHVRGEGYEADCEKYNAAQLAGWMVLRFTPGMIKRGKAGSVIENAIQRAVNGDI